MIFPVAPTFYFSPVAVAVVAATRTQETVVQTPVTALNNSFKFRKTNQVFKNTKKKSDIIFAFDRKLLLTQTRLVKSLRLNSKCQPGIDVNMGELVKTLIFPISHRGWD